MFGDEDDTDLMILLPDELPITSFNALSILADDLVDEEPPPPTPDDFADEATVDDFSMEEFFIKPAFDSDALDIIEAGATPERIEKKIS